MGMNKQVKERIVADHRRIRIELDHLLQMAGQLQGEAPPVITVRECLRAFVASLREHIDLEDRVWVAELERRGRLAQAQAMKARHGVQRRALEALEADREELGDPVILAHRIRTLGDEVRDDMELEDAVLAGRERSVEPALAAALMSDQTR